MRASMRRSAFCVAVILAAALAASNVAYAVGGDHVPAKAAKAHAFWPQGPGGREAGVAPASTSIPLKNLGGRVQDWARTYTIFWLPPGYHYETGSAATSTGDQRYWTLIDRYLNDVGFSTFYNPTTQYYDSFNYITNRSALTDAVIDRSAYPVHNGSVYTTDADIQAEVAKEVQANQWNYGLHHTFLVFTAAGVLTWESHLGWSNNGSTGYCAYHTYFNGSGYGLQNVNLVYANMPSQAGHLPCYAKRTVNGTTQYFHPNGDSTADSAVSTTSHEQFEAVTDPYLNAWKDANGDENGDKCAYIYGTVGNDGGNVTINSHRYILQGEWSNVLFNAGYFGCTWYRGQPYH